MPRAQRLPSRIRLPYGFTVKVRLVRRGPKAHELAPDEEAAWHVDDREVRVWEGLTPRQQHRALAHELVHVVIDFHNWVDCGGHQN